jgi:hypothetical protein
MSCDLADSTILIARDATLWVGRAVLSAPQHNLRQATARGQRALPMVWSSFD